MTATTIDAVSRYRRLTSVSKLRIGRFVDTTARRTLHDAWCLYLQHRRDVVQRPRPLGVVAVGAAVARHTERTPSRGSP
jgi:hypothetical protein